MKPKMPTISMVKVQLAAETTRTRRQPNLSVRAIRETEATKAMIAIICCLVVFKDQKPTNLLKIVVTRNALLNPLCLKNRLEYVFKNNSPVSC
jgi:hypothetical protein